MMKKIKQWYELTDEQKEAATEQYVCIRECEEERNRDDVNEIYTEPIDASYVSTCRFEVDDKDGSLEVII